jgi:putative ABC transport system substrate-binding protein
MDRRLIDTFELKFKSAFRNLKSAILLCAMLLAPCFPAEAQQTGKIPRIGFATGSVATGTNARAFRQHLKELGYIEGKNLIIELRDSEGKGPAVEADQARELVRLNVDVLVVSAYPAIRAAKDASSIPIVMVTTQDPVATGLIDSLARPGGNLTGVTHLARELSGKRLELLLEIVPNLSRVGFLISKGSVRGSYESQRYQDAARALKIDYRIFEFSINIPDTDLPSLFAAALKERVGAIIAIRNGTINRLAPRIAELAIKNRLPAMFEKSDAVYSGGLVSYTADETESYKRAAVIVDKILKGAKPQDLPVEQPTKFEFIINLKTAKQIGLTIPPNVLARADKVIR